MGLRFACARAISALSTWGLKSVFHRPAANFPGKIALYADRSLIADLRPRLSKGSVLVVGTNGKTTCTNLLADSLERAGEAVVCNRTGANLDSGVATALLHTKGADWGVFESDELWLAKILPFLQSDYVLLLNLFRDQLDRVGEIDYIQDRIVEALKSSPNTVLVYNADDPLCQTIADRAPNRSVAFGIGEDLHLSQNTVSDAPLCQTCSSLLEYTCRQYGQLGEYRCPNCDFRRAAPDFLATDVEVGKEGLSFAVNRAGCGTDRIEAPFSGAYMVYNLLAVFAAASCAGASPQAVVEAIDAFDPKNGRLQSYNIGGTPVLLNLAKNPTGFNQNISLVLRDEGPKAVAFFVNDKEGDGRDVSWLWDIDFQKLAGAGPLVAFAGGIRKNDVQVRLKYAGIDAELVEGAPDALARIAEVLPDAKAYFIANYTALPVVKADLDRLEAAGAGKGSDAAGGTAADAAEDAATAGTAARFAALDEPGERPLVVVHMLPDLLNLYGDGGNVTVLSERLRRRGIPVRIERVEHGERADFAAADIVVLGGGPDREQRLASEDLQAMREDLIAYVEDDGVLLAICGGFQILGSTWLLGGESVSGLGVIDIETRRAEGGSRNRLIGDIALTSFLADVAVVGYENHAGRTFLGPNVKPFGQVVGSAGKGNNDVDGIDGALYRNVVGTYLHGPLLAKNPDVADELIGRALARRARKSDAATFGLAPLDDAVELAANEFIRRRFGA